MEKTKRTFDVSVIAERCKACYLCVAYCKKGVLRAADRPNKMGYFYAEKVPGAECSGCMVCTLVCPDLSIEVYGEQDIHERE